MSCGLLILACDADTEPGVAEPEVAESAATPAAATRATPARTTAEDGCTIGALAPAIDARWSAEPTDRPLELSSPRGEFTAVLANESRSGITAGVQLVLRVGGRTVVDLPTQRVPAGGSVDVAVDLAAAGMPREATLAPGQVMLRVVMEPGTDHERIAWSDPAYTHYDAERGVYLVYDARTLRDRYRNGDLTGRLAVPGGTPGAEFVLVGGGA